MTWYVMWYDLSIWMIYGDLFPPRVGGTERSIVSSPVTNTLSHTIHTHTHTHILSDLFYSILFCSILFCSVLFCSILFCSVLFCSVLRYYGLTKKCMDGKWVNGTYRQWGQKLWSVRSTSVDEHTAQEKERGGAGDDGEVMPMVHARIVRAGAW